MPSLVHHIEQLDSFAKPHDEYRAKTVAGGLISLVSGMCILILALLEIRDFQHVSWKPELVVDKSRKDRMAIDFDISFPKVPCFALTLDVMDEADEHQNNVESTLRRVRTSSAHSEPGEYHDPDLNHPADYCGSCYGADGKNPNGQKLCCNSCSAVFGAYEQYGIEAPKMAEVAQCVEEQWEENIKNHANEGCRATGRLHVNKIAGNFHFAPGKSYDAQNYHIHDIRFLEGLHLDFSHTIHYLAFGDHHENVVNPLDGASVSGAGPEESFKYHIKIVAAEMHYRNGRELHTNQFAVTQSDTGMGGVRGSFPSVFFNYEISPMIVVYTEFKRPFISLLTALCAIVGGVYTVAMILDGWLFRAERRIRMKIAMGKSM